MVCWGRGQYVDIADGERVKCSPEGMLDRKRLHVDEKDL